jgi:hypothetical protein
MKRVLEQAFLGADKKDGSKHRRHAKDNKHSNTSCGQ